MMSLWKGCCGDSDFVFFWVFLTANIFCIPVLCGPKVSLSLWRIGRTRPFVAAFYMAGQQSLPGSALAAGETYVWWLADSTNLESQILVCCWWKKLRFIFGRESNFRPVSCHDPMRGVELSWESCGGKFGGSFEVDSSTGMLIGEKWWGWMSSVYVFLFWEGGQFIFSEKTFPFWTFLRGVWLRESWCWVLCTLFEKWLCSHHGSETAKNKKRQIITLRSRFSIVFSQQKRTFCSYDATPQWYFPVMGFPSCPGYPVPQCYRCLLREMPHADPDEDSFLRGSFFFSIQGLFQTKQGS